MKDKILALLTAKFSGERKDGLTHLASSFALQAKTEEEAQALVDKLDSAQVTEFVKEWRSGVDTEVTTAKKAAEDKLKKEFEEAAPAGGTPPPTGGQGGNEDVKAIVAAAVKEAVEPLTLKLQGYEDKEKLGARQTLITTKAKELLIPDWRIAEGFTILDSDDETAITQKLTAVKQNMITAGLDKKENGLLSVASTSEDKAKELAKSWAADLPDA